MTYNYVYLLAIQANKVGQQHAHVDTSYVCSLTWYEQQTDLSSVIIMSSTSLLEESTFGELREKSNLGVKVNGNCAC